jgi:lipid-binding SYLF domain-containing protein
MTTLRPAVVMGLLAVATAAGPARAQREPFIVESSSALLTMMMQDANAGAPPGIIAQAQGLIVFPNMMQGGFLIGARHGRGIVVVRTADGGWSNPFFIRATGGEVGFLAGAQANEMVLVFRNRATIQRFLMGRGKLTFGVDASIAAGPVGAGLGANTDPRFEADILTFSRNRGLYAGAAIGGAVARVDARANWAFYGLAVSPPEIVNDVEGLDVPPSVARLHQVLDAYVRAGTPPQDLPPQGRRPRAEETPADDDGVIIETPATIPGFEDDLP